MLWHLVLAAFCWNKSQGKAGQGPKGKEKLSPKSQDLFQAGAGAAVR